MDSPWKNPLPKDEFTTRQVVVYFHSDFWIPINCFGLNEAISLYRKALLRGKELFVFPSGLDLETQNIFSCESAEWQHR